MKNLRELNLTGTQIVGSGFDQLNRLSKLHWLVLNNTQVSDVGLSPIQALPTIQHLWLRSTKVTDAGIPQMIGMGKSSGFVYLYLENTQTTPEGRAALVEASPSYRISPTPHAAWDTNNVLSRKQDEEVK